MPDNEYPDYERLYSQVSSEKLVELDCIGLHLNSPEPAIICKRCGYAITADKDRVSRHLGEVHNVDKVARRGLNKLIRSLNLPDPKSLRLRPDGSASHPYLKKLTGASSCRHCGLRSASHDVLQSHLRHTHPAEIELARKSGRHWLRDHIKTGLTLQSWTAQGVHKSWIIGIEGVQTSEKQLNANILLQETPDAIKDFAQQLLSEEQERLESRLSRKDLVQDTTKANLMTNWMRRTGWEHLLKDTRRDILVAMSNLPVLTGRPLRLEMHAGESLLSSVTVEQRLALIVDATDRLFDPCGDTIRSTDVCVRRWLRSRLPDYPYNTPFELVSKSSSERVYRKELKRCLCFWLRLLQFPPRTVKVILGKSLRRSQRQELTRLWEDPAWSVDQDTLLTDASIPCDESVADESSDEDQDEDEGQGSEDDCTEWSREETLDYSDGYSSTRNSPTPHITTPADPAADLVLRLAYYMTTEDFADGRSSSTMLVFFSAVRGLSDPDGEQYLRPHRFTPILSRLIYCIRLVFIEAILPQLEHPYVNIASRPRHDQLQILNAARRENMCDGTMSSMGEFLSLLDYGRALSRSEGPVYHFYWSEDGQTLSWDGQTYLTMTQFRGLAHEALLQASAHCKRLMYDWDPDYLDLAHVRDRLSNTTNGYSFVSDPANKLEDAYLELFMRACISPVDGLLQKRGKDQSSWDVKAARAYLNAHDDLLRCLMALFQFDWGQACRISELLTLECYNTASRLRGICVYGAKLCAITRSHKARLTTNNEFQVARFFSPAVSRLVYQYLVYIRPTAHALLRKCFHATPCSVLLFAPLHRQATWTTKTFTDELRRLSRSVPGISFQIGAQLYRQISIAITERHVRQAAPFNRSDDTSSTAGEDIAFAWQSGHRPLQRHTTYGLDGAFPDQLQPALLKIYAKLSAEWQAFLQIDKQPNLNSTTRNVSSRGNDSNDHVYSTENIEPLSNRKRPNVGINQAVTAHLQKKRKVGQDTQENHSYSVGSAALDETTIHIPDHVMENTDVYETVDDYPASTTRSRDPSDTASDQNFPSIGPFAYLEEWSLAICKECRTAVLAGEICSHLCNRTHLRCFSKDKRCEIMSQIFNIPGILKSQEDLREFQPPGPNTGVIPFLEPPKKDGLACNSCLFVTRQLKEIQSHCQSNHGWVNSRKRGRQTRAMKEQEYNIMWKTGVLCQRFFQSRLGSSWFQVRQAITY